MTDEFAVPKDVQKLLHDHLESYEHLQILLLLRRERETVWTSDAVSARLHMPAALVAATLGFLRAGGLLSTTADATETRFKYTPDPALDKTVDRLALEYEVHAIHIIKLMNANAIGRLRKAALRTFADAFILRKERDDG